MFGLFLRDRRGSVLPIFAVATVPLLVSMGAVVDYTNAFDEKTVVQDAMDSAALAAGKRIGLISTSEVQAEAEAFFLANVEGKVKTTPILATAIAGSTITLTTTLNVDTYFLGMIGLDEFVLNLKAQATLAMGTLEVVMALDNSGSMAGSKISTLKTAATDLTTTLHDLAATSTKPDPIKIGLAPFAASVNVDPANANADWIDTTAVGTYHLDSMDDAAPTLNGLTYFSYMNDTSWGGCVEERPIPNDVSDVAAMTTDPDTMFVPMFAPDEPDNWTCSSTSCTTVGSGSTRRYNDSRTGARSYNNYLPDFGGICSGDNTKWTCSNGDDDCAGAGIGESEETAFERTCKYGDADNKVTPEAGLTVGGIPGGPNFMCTTTAVTPLTTSQTTIETAIGNMAAIGATNITAGLMWGWRLLSPGAPFGEGRAYTETDNQKILILMTDGANTYYPNSKFLGSWYGAWGYVSKGHLGTTSTSTATLVGKMNERTALACDNAKVANVQVYTVAFNVTDTATLAMLEDCASEPEMAFQSTGESALLAAFTAIGDDITLLRVSQ